MSKSQNTGTNSIRIGGSVSECVVVAGDDALVIQGESNDPIIKEVEALKQVLQGFDSQTQSQVNASLDVALQEIKKRNTDKDRVGSTINAALIYAKKTEQFAAIAERLSPHIAVVVGWLGEGWHSLSTIVKNTIG